MGYSARTLKRYRDRNGGFLIAGQDWCFGPTRASAISWNIITCRQKFHERGRLMLSIDAERKQPAKGKNDLEPYYGPRSCPAKE